MRSIRAGLVGIVLCVCRASDVNAAAAPWLEVKSEHFTVITNSGEREGRHTAWQFEQIRQALLLVWPWAKIDGGRPFVIFAVRDENSLKALGPQYWEGKQYRPASFWVASADREYVALRTDLPEPSDAGSNPYQGAYFAYISMVLNRSMPVRIPAWYRRGLAEVLSNTIVRAKVLHVGRLMDNRLRRMREGGLIPMAEFLAVSGRSKWLTQEADAELFEAQAWAFVHFLMLGDQGAHSAKLDRFNRLLFQGTEADTAIKEAFTDLTPYFASMRSYLQGSMFRYLTAKVDLKVKPEGFTTRQLLAAEAATARGSMLVAMRRPLEARALAQEARGADTASPGPDEIEAALLDGEDKDEEAKVAYARAIERGSKRGYLYYRLAQLEVGYGTRDKAKLERGVALLQKANELEPAYANAFSYHAQMKADLGQAQEAVDLAIKAVTLEPNQTYHRLTGARALWSGGNKEDAITVARMALQAADSDQEKSEAQRFLDFVTNSQPPRPTQTAVMPSTGSVTPATGLSVSATPGTPAPALTPVRIGGEADHVFRCFSDRNDVSCGRALPLLEESCAHKESQACRSLGSLFDGGFGTAMNKSKAAKAYDAGCVLGDKASCARYAVLQVQGLAPPRDDTPGIVTVERLCASERVDDACIGWATLLAARGHKGDLSKARSLLQASCDAKNAIACSVLKSLPADR